MGISLKFLFFGIVLLLNSNGVVLAHEGSHATSPDPEAHATEQSNKLRQERQLDKLHSLFTKVIGTHNPEDQYRLGKMFQLGKGVEKDDIQAYVWTALSLTNGYPGATKTLRDLELQMSTYEVNYAIDLLRKIRELR